jgi:hypothetical protein
MIVFIVIVGFGNRHPWYRLPLVPIFAAFAGSMCAFVVTKISGRARKVVLSIFVGATFLFPAFQSARKLYEPVAAPLREAGSTLNEITPDDSLLVTADNGDPTILYYANRKGWHFLEKGGIYDGDPEDSAQMIVDLDQLRAKGAHYLVFTSNTSWWLDYYLDFREHLHATSSLIAATSEFSVYRLEPMPND